MQLTKQRKGRELTVSVDGKIDVNTAVEFGQEINDDLDDMLALIIDFSGVTYISSMGLRVILELQKRMERQGHMKIKNVQKPVMEVFEMTGFSNILDIE
jgi:anti-sigma B factor antagonist